MLDVKLVVHAVFWAALVVAAAAIFGSPAGVLAEY